MSLPNDNHFGTGVLLWHQWLTGEAPALPDGESPTRKPEFRKDNGARPAMRRCRTVGDALLAPPFALFVRCVLPDEAERKAAVSSQRTLASLARAAVAVGQVGKADLKQPFPEQMATDTGSGRPRVSRVVAHGLLNTEDPDEALRHAIQIIGTLGDTANVVDLAYGMRGWPRARNDWAYRYNDHVLGIGR